jgi:hypothetical protein
MLAGHEAPSVAQSEGVTVAMEGAMGRHLRQEIRSAPNGERALALVIELRGAGANKVSFEWACGMWWLTAYYPEGRPNDNSRQGRR